MVTAEQCKELADQYKRLSQADGISKDRQFILQNISRSFSRVASQLDRLAALTRDEARRPRQLSESGLAAVHSARNSPGKLDPLADR
jgi:hypothetical protein